MFRKGYYYYYYYILPQEMLIGPKVLSYTGVLFFIFYVFLDLSWFVFVSSHICFESSVLFAYTLLFRMLAT